MKNTSNLINALLKQSVSSIPSFSSCQTPTSINTSLGEQSKTDNSSVDQLPPGFAEAASELKVTIADFVKALQATDNGHPSYAAAARELGISEEKLLNVIFPPPPPRR